MKENFDKALAFVLKSEGGYVNHPQDPGGMTNLGVTKRAWERYVGRTVDETEMRSLTPANVAPFYKIGYWNAASCDKLPSGLDYVVFDAAVNMGPPRAIKLLQQACNVTADGDIGPKTLAAVAATPNLLEKYSLAKELFYRSLKTFPIYGKGWLNRIADVEKNAATLGA